MNQTQICGRCKTELYLIGANFRQFKTGRWSKHCHSCRQYFKDVVSTPPHHKRAYNRTWKKADLGTFGNIKPIPIVVRDGKSRTEYCTQPQPFVYNEADFPKLS